MKGLPWLLLAGTLFLAGCSIQRATQTRAEVEATFPPLEPTYEAFIAAHRSPDIPDLPFADNPDPSQCGIPVQWGTDDPAWLNGFYDGELIQATVLLYDSHLRLDVAASFPHGTRVKVLLYQQNPHLDYYLVKVEGAPPPNEGWIPDPFLSFSPVAEYSSS